MMLRVGGWKKRIETDRQEKAALIQTRRRAFAKQIVGDMTRVR